MSAAISPEIEKISPAVGELNAAAQHKAVFTVSRLCKRYTMGEVTVDALRDIELQLYESEFVVMLGPSGSGKSTLLNILGGLDRASSGEVYFRDLRLSEADDRVLTRFRRERVGFVFQFYNLIPSLTALENVELIGEIATDPMRAQEALEMVGLKERLHHFPAQLSGGEQQRVAIARAIVKRPEILLCDEPTGALDFSTGKLVLEVIEHVNRQLGTTTAVITHNSAIAAIADRVISMRSGEIVQISVNKTKARPADLMW